MEDEGLTWEIIAMRRALGLPAIELKSVQCRRKFTERGNEIKRCAQIFEAQMMRGVQTEHFCPRCRHALSNMVEG